MDRKSSKGGEGRGGGGPNPFHHHLQPPLDRVHEGDYFKLELMLMVLG